MSVSNYLVIMTENKDFWSTNEAVTKTINDLVKQASNPPFYKDQNNRLCEVVTYPSARMIQISFTLKGYKRCLGIFFNCDRDFSFDGLEGNKLIFSLDLSNVSDEVLNALAQDEYLKSLGDVYRFSDLTRDSLLNCKV